MAVTMEDVAKAAGVTRSTVSRALANSPRVKPETRAEIQRIAREMGYLPNAVARGLTTKRTYNLGVLLLDITEAFVSELVRDMDNAARKRDYGLVISHCGYEFDQIRTSVNMLIERRVDAIIVADRVITDIYHPLLEASELPLVVINMGEMPFSVKTDNREAACRGVEYLLDLGHQRIGYIGSARAKVESRERQLGYEDALKSRHIEMDRRWVTIPANWRAAEAGREGMSKLLNLSTPLTAVFCFNDLTAIGAMAEIFASGLRVPQDISVLGFDNTSLAPHTVPALTTMAQPKEQMAELAVENALRLLDDEQAQFKVHLRCDLIVRDSTAQPYYVGSQ